MAEKGYLDNLDKKIRQRASLKRKIHIILIDNYDSFTFNLYQSLGVLGASISVFRNDSIKIEEIREIQPDRLVISPGPGWPDDAGISKTVISEFCSSVPILGVCLGHQCIGEVFGAKIGHAGEVMHGKTSLIKHDSRTIFKDIADPFRAARYHSLAINAGSLPDFLEVSAWSEDGTIMGIRHKEYPVEGVQFHPESFLTSEGRKLLENFCNL